VAPSESSSARSPEEEPAPPSTLSLRDARVVDGIATTVSIEREGDVNRVIVERDGVHSILVEAPTSAAAVGAIRVFTGVRLNRSGRYVLVTAAAYEVELATVYDVETRATVVTLMGTDRVAFTPDGNFVYACAANVFGGEYYGKVVSVRNGKTVYAMPVNAYASYEYDIRCGMESDTVVRFVVDRLDANGRAAEEVAPFRFDLREVGTGKP